MAFVVYIMKRKEGKINPYNVLLCVFDLCLYVCVCCLALFSLDYDRMGSIYSAHEKELRVEGPNPSVRPPLLWLGCW